MNIIAWIGGIISLLKLAPQVVALIREVLKLINGLKTEAVAESDEAKKVAVKGLIPKLQDALKDIREKRSTEKLESLQAELNNLCGPNGCKL